MSVKVQEKLFSRVDAEYAFELLTAGKPTGVVQAKLVERGMTTEEATRLLNELFMRILIDHAMSLLNEGWSPEETKQRLVERGWDEALASSIVDDLVDYLRDQAARMEEAETNPLMQFLGVVAILAGIGLFIGNRTGAFPTIPFAGFAAMAIGSLILSSAGKR